MISVVIPTITGREEWVAKCEAAYRATSPPDTEYIVVKDEPSCGHAWQKGYEQSRGEYVHFTADDITPHEDWWREAVAAASSGRVPIAWVEAPNGTRQYCDSPLGDMGMFPNVLVPFLSREMLEQGGWLLPVHYGSDDWVTYLAANRGIPLWPCPGYRMTHHVASEGRNYKRRHGDVLKLCEAMAAEGYVPPVYQQLEANLRYSETGLDAVRIGQLDRMVRNQLREQRGYVPEDARPALRIMASQFKNELDVLEIRLETIGHLFDIIVIAEATVDQRGRPKALVFPDHQERFSRWANKLRYVVVDDMPVGGTHEDDVARERWQRDALVRGMPELRDDDLVYVSDLDEIPYPDVLQDALDRGERVRFAMDLFVYALNWRWLDRGCRVGTLGAIVYGKDILRKSICDAVLWDERVKGLPGVNGWHLTYQGGVEAIQAKITGMMDKAEHLVMPGVDPAEVVTREWIQESIDTGRDVFGRTYRPSEWVDVDQLPPIVAAYPERYAHMMVPRPDNQDEIESQPRCTCGAVWAPDTAQVMASTGNVRGVLAHFPYCALADVPGTMIFDADNRARPRAKDV